MKASTYPTPLCTVLCLLAATTVVASADASVSVVQSSFPGASQFQASIRRLSANAATASAAAAGVGGSPQGSSKAAPGQPGANSTSSGLPPLIPLQLMLGQPRFRLPQLSPDGRSLAFLQPSPSTRVSSVFVTALPPSSGSSTSSSSSSQSSGSSTSSNSAPSASIPATSLLARGLLKPVQVTHTPTPVGDFFWAKDGKGILFVVDSGAGTENYHLHWVPLTFGDDSSSSSKQQGGQADSGAQITPGTAVNLTPFKGVKTQGLWLSPTNPGRVLVGLNRRSQSVFDIYSVDLRSHNITLDTVNPGNVTAWVVNPEFKISAAVMAADGDGSRHLVHRDTNTHDGCPTAGTAAAAAGGSKQPAAPAADAKAGNAGTPKQKQQPGRKSFHTDTAAGAQQQQHVKETQLGKPAIGSMAGIGRRLLQLAADFGALSPGVTASSSHSKAGGGAGHVDAAVADSSSKSRVACWGRVYVWPFGEDGKVLGFNQAADGLFITSSVGRDTTELQLISTTGDSPGQVKQRIASHPLVDIGEVVFEVADRQPGALALAYHKPVWSFAQQDDQQEWQRLEAWRPGEVAQPVSRSQDKKVWLVEYSKGDSNTGVYLHHRGTFPPQLLFNVQPALSNYTLAATHPVVITARDGLAVPGYLTLPALPHMPKQLPTGLAGKVPGLNSFAVLQRSSSSSSSQQQEQEQRDTGVSKVDWKLPMVLMVHGGPWRRTSWGSSDSITQWLANRGYAVLNVNFRGSTGFGKKFSHQGDGQWGVGSMQHDLSDAVAWAVDRGVADPKRVCIMGSSYGGYATFAGLAFTPELYRCGVAFSGISNLADFARAMPPYWGPIRNRWLLRVGDVTSDDALNRRLSPVFHAGSMRAPLLMGQGGNDVRVTQAEAAAMFEALKVQGRQGSVQWVLYPDEGHSITRLANRLDFYSRAEQLLADQLGGRREPPLKPHRSTAQVKSH